LLSSHRNTGKNHDIKTANKSFENVAQLKYFETTETNQKLIQEEIKSILRSGNACYRLVQYHLSSRLLSKNINIGIYKTTILPVVLYGCETWSMSLKKEHRLRVSEDSVLRTVFAPKRIVVIGSWRVLHNEKLHNFNSSQDN
jgi:hypothetical protein